MQFKKENPDKRIGFSTFALLRLKWCIPVGAARRYTQYLCLHLSPKHKTHAGSDEFFFQLQTNNEAVCVMLTNMTV